MSIVSLRLVRHARSGNSRAASIATDRARGAAKSAGAIGRGEGPGTCRRGARHRFRQQPARRILEVDRGILWVAGRIRYPRANATSMGDVDALPSDHLYERIRVYA